MVRPKFYLMALDLALACGCLMAGYLLRFGSLEPLWAMVGDHRGLVIVALYGLTILFVGYFLELYQQAKFVDRRFQLRRSLATAIGAFFLLSACMFLFSSIQFGRGVLLLTLVLFFAAQYGSRLLIYRCLSAAQFATKVLILGAGELADRMAGIVPRDDNLHSYVRFVSCTQLEPLVDKSLIVGKVEDIDEIVHAYRPQKIIVALNERRGHLPLKELMRSKLRGVEVLDAASYFEQIRGCLMIENIQPSTFVYTQGFRMTPFMRAYKRLIDVALSGIGLVMVSPLLPLVALAIKVDSPGPVLYRQLRVGEGEVEFFVYKFRTMAVDAEAGIGAVWAQKNDARVTRLGRFLRKTRIDEIPQLYNVLRGDMSFIGPRPERMAFVERLKETIPFYSIRHFVKPGLTGWAQVSYPYGASDEDALEKLRYDLYYIKNYSVMLDFQIVLATVRVVTSGFGGR